MSMSALDYRKRRGLDKRDEQMAILVQRVSGSRYEGFFMPCAAGVGYSASPYRIGAEQPKSGMLRLVMGLGTAAVDRRTGSYPRLVSLDEPRRVLSTNDSDRQQFSQRIVDAISAKSNDVEGFDAMQICQSIPPHLRRMLYSHNYETERYLRDRGDRQDVLFVSCDGLTRNEQLMADMRDILALIQTHYEYPVDTEYTINFAPDGSYVIDLLQCRPLQVSAQGDKITVPNGIDKQNILLETRGVSMGFSRELPLDAVVWIDPILYYQLPYRRKYEIKEALSAVNWHYRGQGRALLLLTPGRICTSSPELGVPSGFSDISEFSVIAEVSESKAGYIPELSFGSHIFQDLVEAGILYTAVFEKGSTVAFAPRLLQRFPEKTQELTTLADDLRDVFHVFEPPKDALTLYYDMKDDHLLVVAQ